MPTTKILSFFWQHIKPYKWYYLVMLSAPVLSAFYPFACNYAIKLFVDTMAVDAHITFGDLTLPIVLFVVTQLLLDTVWRISNVAEWRSEPFVRRSILLESYNYLQNHSYGYFQDNFSGALSSKIKGILDGYDKFWSEMHHGLLARLFKILVGLVALAMINFALGIFIFSWALIYSVILFFLSGRLNQFAHLESNSRHNLIGQISDKITNIGSLFAFSARTRELGLLDEEIKQDFIPRQKSLYKFSFKLQLSAGILYQILFLSLLFFVIYLRVIGGISIGDFAFIFGMTLTIAEDIWLSTTSLQDFSRAMGDLSSALSLIYEKQDLLDGPKAKTLQVIHPKIEFHNLNFAYDEGTPVFENLNLVIHPGEKVGIVGETGSGKSSLVSLLLGYFSPNSGEILIDDQNVKDCSKDSVRNSIALIPQDTLLFHRTLMENIRFGKPEATDAEVMAACRKAHIHDLITSMPEGYQTLVGERGIKLSGGQRQRVSIARAILKDAPILILDEATSALDSKTEKQIQESLSFLLHDSKKTLIAIAHRLSTLKNMDRIIVIDAGMIVEEGKHDALLANPKSLYKKLWDLQMI